MALEPDAMPELMDVITEVLNRTYSKDSRAFVIVYWEPGDTDSFEMASNTAGPTLQEAVPHLKALLDTAGGAPLPDWVKPAGGDQ